MLERLEQSHQLATASESRLEGIEASCVDLVSAPEQVPGEEARKVLDRPVRLVSADGCGPELEAAVDGWVEDDLSCEVGHGGGEIRVGVGGWRLGVRSQVPVGSSRLVRNSH